MMKVQNGNDYVRFLLNKKSTKFYKTDTKVGKIPVFKDSSKKMLDIFTKEAKDIEYIAQKYHAEMILACSHTLFKYMVKWTEDYEIDINLYITENREMVHYAAVGFEPTVLIIAADY